MCWCGQALSLPFALNFDLIKSVILLMIVEWSSMLFWAHVHSKRQNQSFGLNLLSVCLCTSLLKKIRIFFHSEILWLFASIFDLRFWQIIWSHQVKKAEIYQYDVFLCPMRRMAKWTPHPEKVWTVPFSCSSSWKSNSSAAISLANIISPNIRSFLRDISK